MYNVVLDCKAVNSDEDYLDPTVNALVTIFGLDEGELPIKRLKLPIRKRAVLTAFFSYCDLFFL